MVDAGKPITLVHLYPEKMNIYGDTGNVNTIKRRFEQRGYAVNVVKVETGDELPDDTEIIVGGGGQDSGQFKVADDLVSKKSVLVSMKEEGVPMFVVCGTYQLFGHWFKTSDGREIPGIGIFDMTTTAGPERLIGNVTASSDYGSLVGFENHSGETTLGKRQKPLAVVTKGAGNNSMTGDEGAISGNAFGTYMHGPLLPKNPQLADELIKRVLARRGDNRPLAALNDTMAQKAAQIAATRPR